MCVDCRTRIRHDPSHVQDALQCLGRRPRDAHSGMSDEVHHQGGLNQALHTYPDARLGGKRVEQGHEKEKQDRESQRGGGFFNRNHRVYMQHLSKLFPPLEVDALRKILGRTTT